MVQDIAYTNSRACKVLEHSTRGYLPTLSEVEVGLKRRRRRLNNYHSKSLSLTVQSVRPRSQLRIFWATNKKEIYSNLPQEDTIEENWCFVEAK